VHESFEAGCISRDISEESGFYTAATELCVKWVETVFKQSEDLPGA